MGKIKTYHSKTSKGNKHSKNTAKQSETNIYIFHFPVNFNNTTHELFRFKRRFQILKKAFAGHKTRYLRSPRSCFPSVCFRQT